MFRLEKETKAIKDRILRDIKNLFQHEKEETNYYNPVRVNNFIEHESNSDRYKTLSVEEYLNQFRPPKNCQVFRHSDLNMTISFAINSTITNTTLKFINNART